MILLAFLRNQRGNTRRINPAVVSAYHPLGEGDTAKVAVVLRFSELQETCSFKSTSQYFRALFV